MTLTSILNTISSLLSTLLPVLVSLGVLYFIWGVIFYVIADDEEAKQKGRDRIVFGIIGLAVIVSVWGLVGVLNSTFGLGGTNGLTIDGTPVNVSSLVPGKSSGTCTTGNTFQAWLNYFTCIISSSIIPLLFAVAVVMFVWGAIKFFIIEVDEESKREQGRQFMLWGIIALAVMISMWGLVNILTTTFEVKDRSFIPQVKP